MPEMYVSASARGLSAKTWQALGYCRSRLAASKVAREKMRATKCVSKRECTGIIYKIYIYLHLRLEKFFSRISEREAVACFVCAFVRIARIARAECALTTIAES
jgi:hypothetical protein